jgi:ribosomal protein S18 acetylase RimI-like enzyme
MAFFTRPNPAPVPRPAESPDAPRSRLEPDVVIDAPGERHDTAGLAAGVARLLGVRSASDAEVTDFLAQARAEGTDLSRLRVSRRLVHGAPGPIGQAALAMASPGRTLVVVASSGFGPRAGSAAAALAERAAVIDATCAPPHAAPAPRLAQVLLEPAQRELIDAFALAGFTRLAELGYLRRPLPPYGEPRRAEAHAVVWPPGFAPVPLTAFRDTEGNALLRRALEASYEGTLDCPALCGLRDLDDVVESHKSVGHFDPALWTLLLKDAEPVGCILLSAAAPHASVELVYLGLASSVRGLGLAGRLLRHGIATLAARPEATLACAVDLANSPALALYQRAGFRQFTTRVAMVRPLPGPRPPAPA